MCGNQFLPHPYRKDLYSLNDFAAIFADEILGAVHELNNEQIEQFFEWMEKRFSENNFEFTESSIEERLRIWLSFQSTVLLIVEHQIILNKIELLKSTHETKTT